jgi:hypothetical protein
MKNFKINYIWFIKTIFLAVIAMFFSCNNQSTENKTSSEEDKLEKENFNEFYKHFETDSIFQLSRIKFPLKGYYMDETREFDSTINHDENKDNYVWSLKDWQLSKLKHLISMDSSFNIKYYYSDSLTRVNRRVKDSGCEVKEEYLLKDGKWYLSHFKVWSF